MSNYEFVLSDGEIVPVVISVRKGACNITLRPKTSPRKEILISKPWLVRDSSALAFLEEKRTWCEKIFSTCLEKTELRPGDRIEFLGKCVLLSHNPAMRSNQFITDDLRACQLIIGGDISMFNRRVRDFIKSEFLAELKNMIHSAPKEFWPTSISVRDTSSRWGSRSSSGAMSFSWRLAFAPTDVMRYVVMHELAHVKQMNHSAQFWAQVAVLYGFGVERAKRWLKQNGASLHKYF